MALAGVSNEVRNNELTIMPAVMIFSVDKDFTLLYISTIHVNTDAMNGINLMKRFQRAVGWCKTVYGFRCLGRECQTLSGYVIFQKMLNL